MPANLYEDYLKDMLKKYTSVESGITKPWETPEYRGVAQGLETGFLSNKAEIERSMAAKGITGGAAADLYSKLNTGDISQKLGAINQIMAQYSGKGTGVAETGADRLLREYQSLLQYALGKAQIKSQERIARAGGVTSGFGSAMTGGGSAAGGCGCYIFMEGGGLTSNVRLYRDIHFKPNTFLAYGYEKMASWIVPVMKRNRLVKWIIKKIMIEPLVSFADAYKQNHKGWKVLLFCPFGLFWTRLWDMYGRV